MSLILDALNKADRENRQPDSSPGLDTEHELPDENTTSTKATIGTRTVAASVVFGILVIAVVLFYILSGDDSPDQTEKASSPELSSPQSTATAPRANSEAESISSNNAPNNSQQTLAKAKLSKNEELKKRFIEAQYEEQRKQKMLAQTTNKPSGDTESSKKNSSRISGLYESSDTSAKVPTTTRTTATTTTTTTTTTTNGKVALNLDKKNEQQALADSMREDMLRLELQTDKTQHATLTSQKVTSQKTPQQKAAKIQNTQTANDEAKKNTAKDTQMAYYPDIGSIRDLPFSAQEKIPSMMYTNHIYTNSRKSVEINGKKYREKSKVSTDLTIEKILEDGIILRYQQHNFKMSAYNNWINL